LSEIIKVIVCHILNELRPSGAEVMLKLAAPQWQAAGCFLHIIAIGPRVGEFAQTLLQVGYKIHHVPYAGKRIPWATQLFKKLQDIRPDVIHNHNEANAVLFAILCRAVSRSYFRTIHNNFPYRGLLRVRKIIERFLARVLGCHHISIGTSVQHNERVRLLNDHPLLELVRPHYVSAANQR